MFMDSFHAELYSQHIKTHFVTIKVMTNIAMENPPIFKNR